jgi:hypothetical protein
MDGWYTEVMDENEDDVIKKKKILGYERCP